MSGYVFVFSEKSNQSTLGWPIFWPMWGFTYRGRWGSIRGPIDAGPHGKASTVIRPKGENTAGGVFDELHCAAPDGLADRPASYLFPNGSLNVRTFGSG